MATIDKKLIAKYQLSVYENGFVEIRPMAITSHQKTNYDGCSSRIKQALLVLSSMQNYVNSGINYEEAFVKATTDLAEELNASRQSILDKVTRQMGLKAADFREKARLYFERDNLEIKDILLDHIGAYTRENDEFAINSFFKSKDE